MKANRKFVEQYDAVDAIMGVILMIALTVAIAATVYVYVSGMLGGTVYVEKCGIVKCIEYNVVFGSCFTDYRNEIHFYDGSVFWTDVDDDLKCIEFNNSGCFTFISNNK